VPGRVSHVSHDAIQDEKKGLIYSVKVILDQSSLLVDGKEALLTPGMSVNVEIKTGARPWPRLLWSAAAPKRCI
jgi:hemolysin D